VLALLDAVVPGHPDLARRVLSRIVGESVAPVVAGTRRISARKLAAWTAAVNEWLVGRCPRCGVRA
jgi:hypothetical protein